MKLTKQFNLINKHESVYISKSGSFVGFARGLKGCLTAMRWAKERGGKAFLCTRNTLSGREAVQLYPSTRQCCEVNIRDEAGMI